MEVCGELGLAELGFERAIEAETGRPAYDPGDLLCLYLYDYLHRVRSSRRLEKEAARNLQLMWLLRKLRPDFRTMPIFEKRTAQPSSGSGREFTLLCKQLDLIGGELVAIDASRFQTVNGEKRNFTAAKLERQIEEIDAKIEAYLDQLESRGLLTRGQLRRQTTEIYQSCWRAEAG